MKETLIKHLQGGNALEVWIAGLIWTCIGIALVKLYFYKREYKFNILYWLNDNIKDVGLGLLICLILLRMGNLAIKLIEQISNYQLGEVKDFVAFLLFTAIFIQYRLHKARKPISKEIATEMVECNETTKRRRRS